MHPVFHVSLLKKHVGSTPVTAGMLPKVNQEDVVTLEPQFVLQRRQIKRDNKEVCQWLIQWKGMEKEEASWEDVTFIHQQFPQFKS